MSWSNGNFFTKNENKNIVEFLASQNLDEKQQTAIAIWHKSQLSGQLNLWASLSVLFGGAIGFLIGLST